MHFRQPHHLNLSLMNLYTGMKTRPNDIGLYYEANIITAAHPSAGCKAQDMHLPSICSSVPWKPNAADL